MPVPRLWRRLPASILGRLRLLLAVLFGVGATAALVAAWIFAISAATEAYDPLLISGAMQIAESIDIEGNRVTVTPPDSAFETLALSQDDRFFYAVRDPSGRLLTGHGDLSVSGTNVSASPQLRSGSYRGASVRIASIDHFVAAPGVRGWCNVIVAETRDARRRMAVRLMAKIGAIVLLVSLLGFLASLEAARRALLPLDRIGAALAERAAHDLAPLRVDSPRETLRLVQAINDAMAKLNARMAKLQQFTAIAAHQIRTPLAAVGAQAELLSGERTPAARRARIERVQANVAKLSRVTNQLLGQAMVSYRTDTAPRVPVNLVELLRAVANETIPHALERDLAVELPRDKAPVEVLGDAISLREALANLVDNAVTHGAPTTLRLRVTAEGDEARVIVADDGEGFPREFWDVAQQPFQLARTERSGAGMGISIVSGTVQAHGGRLAFGFTDDGLFQAELRFPLLQQAANAA